MTVVTIVKAVTFVTVMPRVLRFRFGISGVCFNGCRHGACDGDMTIPDHEFWESLAEDTPTRSVVCGAHQEMRAVLCSVAQTTGS